MKEREELQKMFDALVKQHEILNAVPTGEWDAKKAHELVGSMRAINYAMGYMTDVDFINTYTK